MIKADHRVHVRRKKCVAVTVVFAFLVNTAAFANVQQISVWSERRHSRASSFAKATEDTGLPTVALAKVGAPAFAGETINKYGIIRESFKPSSEIPLLIVQDIHLNTEAQRNIAGILSQLQNQNRLGTVGVEGAFVGFDFKPFYEAGDIETRKRIADKFLDSNRIGAPSYVGVTAAQCPTNFIGVDDETLYEANLAGYLDGVKRVPRLKADLEKRKRVLAENKRRVFGPALLERDRIVDAYRNGQMSLGVLLEKIGEAGPVAKKFLEAYRLEGKINFALAERQRKRVVQELAKRVDASEAQELMKSASSDAQQTLITLLNRHQLSLSHSPDFAAYLRYTTLSNSIDAAELIRETNAVISSSLSELAQTQEQKRLIAESRRLWLIGKLLDFSLTPDEWTEYNTLGYQTNLRPFENFYRFADLRSEVMIHNFLKQPSRAGTDVLIVGGFHAPLLTAQLKQRGIAYELVSPKITKIADASGVGYLSVFSRNKTPLEKLFAGEKLFLYPRDIAMATPPAQKVNGQFLDAEQPGSHRGIPVGNIVKSLFLTTSGLIELARWTLTAGVLLCAYYQANGVYALFASGVLMASVEILPFQNPSRHFLGQRTVGFGAPLLYLRSDHDWGGGDIDVLLLHVELAKKTRHSIIQIAPLNRSIADNSPYSPGDDFTFDPAYVGPKLFAEMIRPLADRDPVGYARLMERIRVEIEPKAVALRETSRGKTNPDEFRRLKYEWARLAFEWFKTFSSSGESPDSPVARFRAFVARGQDYALEDRLLFFLVAAEQGTTEMHRWLDDVRTRKPETIRSLKQKLRNELEFEKFVQWILREQTQRMNAIAKAGEWPVDIMLDKPVAPGLASVWIHPEAFQINAQTMKPSVTQGVPGMIPQHWGFVLPNPANPKAREFLLNRFLFLLSLCSILRIDYFPGYYYTWQLTEDLEGAFTLDGLGIRGDRKFEIIKDKLREKLPAEIRDLVFTANGDLKNGSMILAARKEKPDQVDGWYEQYSAVHGRSFWFSPITPDKALHLLRGDDIFRVGFFAPSFGERIIVEFLELAQLEGKTLVGEALGWVPRDVLDSMYQLGVPGYEIAAFYLNGGIPSNDNSLFATTNFDTQTARQYLRSVPGHPFDALRNFFRWVAGSRASMVVVPMTDYTGSDIRVNVPGEKGHWTVRASVAVEPLLKSADASGTDNSHADQTVALMHATAEVGERNTYQQSVPTPLLISHPKVGPWMKQTRRAGESFLVDATVRGQHNVELIFEDGEKVVLKEAHKTDQDVRVYRAEIPATWSGGRPFRFSIDGWNSEPGYLISEPARNGVSHNGVAPNGQIVKLASIAVVAIVSTFMFYFLVRGTAFPSVLLSIVALLPFMGVLGIVNISERPSLTDDERRWARQVKNPAQSLKRVAEVEKEWAATLTGNNQADDPLLFNIARSQFLPDNLDDAFFLYQSLHPGRELRTDLASFVIHPAAPMVLVTNADTIHGLEREVGKLISWMDAPLSSPILVYVPETRKRLSDFLGKETGYASRIFINGRRIPVQYVMEAQHPDIYRLFLTLNQEKPGRFQILLPADAPRSEHFIEAMNRLGGGVDLLMLSSFNNELWATSLSPANFSALTEFSRKAAHARQPVVAPFSLELMAQRLKEEMWEAERIEALIEQGRQRAKAFFRDRPLSRFASQLLLARLSRLEPFLWKYRPDDHTEEVLYSGRGVPGIVNGYYRVVSLGVRGEKSFIAHAQNHGGIGDVLNYLHYAAGAVPSVTDFRTIIVELGEQTKSAPNLPALLDINRFALGVADGLLQAKDLTSMPGASNLWHGTRFSFTRIGAIEGFGLAAIAAFYVGLIAMGLPPMAGLWKFGLLLTTGTVVLAFFSFLLHKNGVHVGNHLPVALDVRSVFQATWVAFSSGWVGVWFIALGFVQPSVDIASIGALVAIGLAASAILHAVRNERVDEQVAHQRIDAIAAVVDQGLRSYSPERVKPAVRRTLAFYSKWVELSLLGFMIQPRDHQLLIPASTTEEGIRGEIEAAIKLRQHKPMASLRVFLSDGNHALFADGMPGITFIRESELKTAEDFDTLVPNDGYLQLLVHGADKIPVQFVQFLLARHPEKVRLVLMNVIAANTTAVRISTLPGLRAMLKIIELVRAQA